MTARNPLMLGIQPARNPLMLVNNKKIRSTRAGLLYRLKTYRFCLTPQISKPAFHNNDTQIWVGETLRNHLLRMQPSLGSDASCIGTTRQGDQIRKPATSTRDAYLRPMSQSTTVYHTETKSRSGHYGSRPGPAHYDRVFCRH